MIGRRRVNWALCGKQRSADTPVPASSPHVGLPAAQHDTDRVTLAVHLLGRPTVAKTGVAQPAPRGHKAWALLGLIVLSAEPPSRQLLAGLLFSEADDPFGALRWNLARLRLLLGDEATLAGDPVQLRLPADALVDVRALASGTWVEAIRLPGLGRELLEGVEPDAGAAFEAWLLAERRHVSGLSAAILREAATARLAAGEAESAIELATRLVAIDEYEEEAHALLIRAHVAAGHGAEARRYLASTLERFRRELGVEPSVTLVRAADINTGPPTAVLSRASRAGAVSLIAAGEAAVGAGAIEAGLDTLRRAVADALESGDNRLRAQALVALGTAYVHGGRGRDGEGATALHAALTAAEQTVAPDLVSEACRELGYIELLCGRYDRAEMWLDRAVQEAPDRGQRVAALAVRGSVVSDRGQTGRAIEILAETAREAVALEKPRLAAWAYTFLARTHILRVEYGEARRAAENALDSVQSANWLTFKPFVDSLVGTIELAEGNVDAASSLFEGAFAVSCQIGDPCWEGMGARGIGMVHLAHGRVEEGIRWLDDARTRCIRIPDAYMWIHAYCLDTLCEAGIAHGMPDARRWVSDLETIAARTGMNEMLVRAYLHRSELGDPIGLESARLCAQRIDNPAVLARIPAYLAPVPA